ncbi:MAG: AsmA-like C-terminal region-containing protein [Bacteroidota bacterium]
MEEFAPITEPKKTFSIWRFLKRLFFTIVIGSLSVIIISVSLVYIYEDDVKAIIIKELNKHLNSEVRIDPKNIDLTILKSFPDCALEFKNFTIMEASNAKIKDTLLYTEKLSLAFNVKDLFRKNYNIKKIELENSQANLKVDKKGNANYIIWKTDTTSKGSDSLSFALEKITLKQVVLKYKNSKAKIKIETTIKKINFKGKFTDSDYMLSADGNAFVSLFQVEKTKYVNDKNLKFDVELDVNKNTYTIKKADTDINSTTLVSNGNFVLQDSLISLDINFNGKNLDISSTLSLLPEKFQNQINDYKSDGEFYAKGEVHYHYSKPIRITSEFGIKQAAITYKPQNTTLSNVNLLGSIDVNNKRSVLKLQNISANLNTNTFSGDVEISNFNDPYLKLNVAAKTKLEELIAFYPIDTIQEISGSIDIKASLEGLVSDLKNNSFSPDIKANGVAGLKDLKAKFKQSTKDLNIPEGELKLTDRKLNVSGLKILKGTSDVVLDGEMPNFLGYLFDPNTPLAINAKVASDNIELEDFLFSTGSSSSGSSAVSVSDKLDLNVEISVKKLSLGKFTANDIKGTVLLKNQKIALKNLSLSAADGTMNLNAFADASGKILKVSGDCNLEKINAQRLFTELNNFGQSTLQDKHIKGFITAHIDFMANWDEQLHVILNSINADGTILIERGELIDFKPLGSLAKYIDMNELKHIRFSTLQGNINIKNQVITLPKTSIKSNAINLEFWGTHSFDNIVDYHIQLLISELLSKRPRSNKQFDEELSLVENDPENRRSVFIRMTGPIDNPTIKYDRKGAKEKIKEDIKQEKQTIKQILKEEFGLFKKDSIKVKEEEKANQKFNIQFGEEKPKKANNGLQPKKKEDTEDF